MEMMNERTFAQIGRAAGWAFLADGQTTRVAVWTLVQPIEETPFQEPAQHKAFGKRDDLPGRVESRIADGFRCQRIAHCSQLFVRNVHVRQQLDLGIHRLTELQGQCVPLLTKLEDAPGGFCPRPGLLQVEMRVSKIAGTPLEVYERGLK